MRGESFELYIYDSDSGLFEEPSDSIDYGKPLCIIDKKIVYAASINRPGVLNRITLNQ